MLQKDDELAVQESRLSQKTLMELENLLNEKGDLFDPSCEKSQVFMKFLDNFDEGFKEKILALHKVHERSEDQKATPISKKTLTEGGKRFRGSFSEIRSWNFEESFTTPHKKVKTSEPANSSFNSLQKSAFKPLASADQAGKRNPRLYMVFPVIMQEESQNLESSEKILGKVMETLNLSPAHPLEKISQSHAIPKNLLKILEKEIHRELEREKSRTLTKISGTGNKGESLDSAFLLK